MYISQISDHLCWYQQKLKGGKVTNFFFKSIYLWNKVFIPWYDMIIFIYKSWSANSGWLTFFVRSKVTRENSFHLKMYYIYFTRAKFLINCHCSKRNIIQIMKNPDSNKAHGHDMISIWMLILCGDLMCQPLEIIFKRSLRNGGFPLERKNVNVVHIQKKKLSSSFTSTYLWENSWTLALWHFVSFFF